MGWRLTRSLGQLVHWVDGEKLELRQGMTVEAKLAERCWVPVRYQWSGQREESPVFFIELPDDAGTVELRLPEGVRLRASKKAA